MGDTHENDLSPTHGGMINGVWVLLGWRPVAHYGAHNVPVTAADHEIEGAALDAMVAAAKAGMVPFAAAMQAEFGTAFWSSIQPCGPGLRAGLLRRAG